ncbi:MAG: hypothetical protein ACI845_000036 [Gammaproteobacteria bacterium]
MRCYRRSSNPVSSHETLERVTHGDFNQRIWVGKIHSKHHNLAHQAMIQNHRSHEYKQVHANLNALKTRSLIVNLEHGQ